MSAVAETPRLELEDRIADQYEGLQFARANDDKLQAEFHEAQMNHWLEQLGKLGKTAVGAA